jgi:hypothetical protein
MSGPVAMPAGVVQVRAEICGRCSAPCEHQRVAAFHGAPCAACPANHWGRYGRCDQFTPPNESTLRPLPIRAAEPTVIDLATRAAYAAWRAAAAALHGERVLVTEDEYAARSVACESCPHWDGAARAGLGKCNAPNCGCTKLKRWLATETCPLRKWPPLSAAG